MKKLQLASKIPFPESSFNSQGLEARDSELISATTESADVIQNMFLKHPLVFIALLFHVSYVSTAFAQGVRYDFAPVEVAAQNGSNRSVANAPIVLCLGTATVSGNSCSPTTQSYTNQALTTLCPAASPVTLANSNVCQGTTDGLGNGGFWLAPGSYIWCVTGAACYNLTAPVGGTASGAASSTAYTRTTHGDRQIILDNPDFEGSTLIPPPGWVSTGNVTISYETLSPAPNKLQSIKLATTFANAGLFSVTRFSVIPGDTYSVTFLAKGDGVSQPVAGIAFNDKNDNFISSILNFTSSTSWIPLIGSGVVPANAVQAQVFLENNVAAASTVWFDQVSVQKTNFPAPVTAPQFLVSGDGTAANPALKFASGAGLFGSTSTLVVSNNGVQGPFFNTNVNLSTNSALYTLGASQDTGISRTAAGTVVIGNGTTGDASGTLKAGAYNTSTDGDRQGITQNPNFEGVAAIPPPGWLVASGTASYETVSPAPGKRQSIKLLTPLQFGALIQSNRFSVVPGDTYSISCAAKADGTGGSAHCFINPIDKNGNQLALIVTPTNTTNSWQTLTASGTIPANAIEALIVLENNSATQPSAVWFDQVSVQKTNFGHPTINTGIVNSGTGLQHFRVASCSTAAATNSGCTTNITWPGTWADTNYTASCTLSNETGAVLNAVAVLFTFSKTTTTMSIQIQNIGANAAASSGTLDCIGIHD